MKGGRNLQGHIDHGTDCCGCGACAVACPKEAIYMEEDPWGFLYPKVNSNNCIECGKCKKVCGYHNILQKSVGETYVAVSCTEKPEESASGGVSAALAAAMVVTGGVVYGCTMSMKNGILVPHHIRVCDAVGLAQIKGSKYVQSDISSIFLPIKQDLQAGKSVLLIGTPCQITAVKGFLEHAYPNFYTVDVVCHGVPSAKIFQDFVSFLEQRSGKQLVDLKFRDKSEGWKLFASLTYQDAQGTCTKVLTEPEELSYYQMFLNSYTYRENCYTCPYASKNRQGDITIGDYWCIDLVHPELLTEQGGEIEESRGVSCLVVNNEKGQHLLDRFGAGVRLWPSTYEQASRYNGQLTHPAHRPKERDKVMQQLLRGYEYVDRWYQRRLKVVKINRKLRGMVPKGVKRTLRWLLKR